MTILKQLQMNEKFRSILKNQKIGWRHFAKYHQYGMLDENNTFCINIGKWNGVYDYNICFAKEQIMNDENNKLLDVFEK